MAYEKDSDPGQSDVVERDGALKRVLSVRFAVRVVLVPVDAVGTVWQIVGELEGGLGAGLVVPSVGWQLVAPVHAVVFRSRTDVIAVLLLVFVVGRYLSTQTYRTNINIRINNQL